MNAGIRVAVMLPAVLVAACGHVKPTAKPEPHLVATEDTSPAPTIPPPVQVTPVLPKPTPATRPETYSVVVNNVRVQELLFALARDARLQIDIDPSLTGSVTLNAIDQTLPQLLTRISRQVDMRYHVDGSTLVVQRDTPYLRLYRIDYVNVARDAKVVGGLSMQVTSTASGVPGAQAGGSSGSNNSTATVNTVSSNKFWETLIDNIKAILRETDRVLPAPAAQQPAAASGAAPAAAPGTPGAAPIVLAAPAGPTFQEAGSVIANPETGILNVRATARQHERIQEFLDHVLANSKRQVLIEATVVEVQLSSQYQRGIDWQRLRSGASAVGVPAFNTGQSGVEFAQRSNPTPQGFNDRQFVFGGAITQLNLNFAFKLLESFGDVRVLSSPKLNVLNNQFAVLKVVDNIVYFTVTAQTSQGGGGIGAGNVTTVNTIPSTVPVGLVMSVVPHISDHDSIALNVRPSISRLLRFVQDPNPALVVVGGVPNFVPEIQTREMESMMRLENGQVAVLGGLMEDRTASSEDAIPGIRGIPGLGVLFGQRADETRKTELVIFLRATVIRDPSVDGDYRLLRHLLPGADFFQRPNPMRNAPNLGPLEAQTR